MTTLCFVRHAKTSMNSEGKWSGLTDCSITAEGKKQAEETFAEYTAEDFNAYYCSPLKRTKQTLDAIIPGQKPIIDKRIIERDFGDWEGKPYSIIDNKTTELYIQGKVQPPNGETYQDVRERVVSFVTDLFQKHKNQKILIVSHATILRMVRDVFIPEMEKHPIKNSQLIVVTDKEFEHYKGGQKYE